MKATSEENTRKVFWADHSPSGNFSALRDPGTNHRASLDLSQPVLDSVEFIQLPNQKMVAVEKHIPFEKVSHVFVCWNREAHFSETVFMVMMLDQKFPHIHCYVQISDETLANILAGLSATPFSTSSYAFTMLQNEVDEDSALYLPLPEDPSDKAD